MKLYVWNILGMVIFFLSVCIGINISHHVVKQDENMLHFDELSPYDKDIYINGKKVEDDSSVVVYNSDIFFSVNMLKKCISEKFISKKGNRVKIRSNKIDSSELLQSENGTYIPMDILLQYVHINNDIFKSNGNMYIDNMLPTSLNFKGTTYYLTDDKLPTINDVDDIDDEILSDGRRAWIDAGYHLYVEDDWGIIYRYKKSQLSIS